ncbi:hypothetical protein ACQ4PT_070983 [Festuca glaucescens]
MSLRRLLGLSAAVSGGLRRSLSTGAAARPPWVLFEQASAAAGSAPGACVRIVEPPRLSDLTVPAALVDTSDVPDPDSDIMQVLPCGVCSASGDGLLLLIVHDSRFTAPIHAKQGANHVRTITGYDHPQTPRVSSATLSPASSPASRSSMAGGSSSAAPHMGVLTQAHRGGDGPPDRLAVAELQANRLLRFLSETGEWDMPLTAPYQLPLGRRFHSEEGDFDQEAFAFGRRLWWVDLTWGAISADPFSDKPEVQWVELPRGSVMPEPTLHGYFRKLTQPRPERPVPAESALLDLGGAEAAWKYALSRYRRMGVSEGKLRYVEVSDREPFVLSSFALGDDGWTLEHRVALSRLWADGDHPWLPLPEKTTPQIGALDPLNGNVIYLMVGRHSVGVDMAREAVIGSSLHRGTGCCVPCVLPQWLESTRIPDAAGNR